MTTISVYASGDRESVSYYRIWQYVDKFSEKRILSRVKYAKFLVKRFYPIGLQPFHIKVFAWLVMCIRIFYFLFIDFFYKPDFLLIQRELVKKKTPIFFRFMVGLLIKRGAKIIWDFDDDILTMKEINRSDFNYLAKVSSKIFVTHEYLKNLIPDLYREKVSILRTTDGDMYKLFEMKKDEITRNRLSALINNVDLVWVATKGNIPFLESIIPALDMAAEKIEKKDGRHVILKVICNGSITIKTKFLCIKNIPWTREIAIEEMIKSHIGIMPLIDSKLSRGKGGFKLIQYMSVGLPCAASSVGFNCEVVDKSFGRLAKQELDWIDAIVELSDVNNWEKMSNAAYIKWSENFSFEKNLNMLRMYMQ